MKKEIKNILARNYIWQDSFVKKHEINKLQVDNFAIYEVGTCAKFVSTSLQNLQAMCKSLHEKLEVISSNFPEELGCLLWIHSHKPPGILFLSKTAHFNVKNVVSRHFFLIIWKVT